MIENQTLSLDEVEVGESYRNCIVTSSNETPYFSDVHFEHCEFQNQHYTRGEWVDCTFKNIVFSNKDFSDSIFYRCRLERCQLLGTNFSNNRWKETQVIDSRGDYMQFSEAILEKSVFERVSLREAFFQMMTIKKGLIFAECALERADFFETKLAGIDFSTSEFESLIFSPQGIKGAIVSHYQAAQILAMLGVKVK